MIEERIKPHVEAIQRLGYTTTSSCGHDMWVTVQIKPMELEALVSSLQSAGYTDFDVVVESCVRRGQTLTKPQARITFYGDLVGDGKPMDLVLLKVDPDELPLYFVIAARHYQSDDQDQGYDHNSYFYDEHTCPTNWTDDIVAVVANGDDDPHGFAKFVRRIPMPDDMDDAGDGSEKSWQELFPEAFE